MSITIRFGNANPQHHYPIIVRDPDTGEPRIEHQRRKAAHLQQSITTVRQRPQALDLEHVELTLSVPNDPALTRFATLIAPELRAHTLMLYELEQVIAVHAGGIAPLWVTCTDPNVQAAIAAHFQCPTGEPTMLVTNGGRDALHHQHLDTAAPPATFTYGALSANTGSGFAATDTTLAGEIATSSGGLVRKQMTFAHTAGTNTSTLTGTWTANTNDSLPVTVASWAALNASSSGTLGHETALSGTVTLNASGASLTVTFTLTA